MAFNDKLKLLRKEKEWSQDALARMLETDGRQISRYETGKFLPSAEVIIKIAKLFNVSVDYLLFEDVTRKPLHFSDDELISKLTQVEDLTKEDKDSLLHFVDAIVAKNQMKSLAHSIK
jgi:transcriptional regulator with XRE-family HTH domain